MAEEITTGSCWRAIAMVERTSFLAIGNDYPEPCPIWPSTVIYCNRSGKIHTGRADDWNRRMEHIELGQGLINAALSTLRICSSILMGKTLDA